MHKPVCTSCCPRSHVLGWAWHLWGCHLTGQFLGRWGADAPGVVLGADGTGDLPSHMGQHCLQTPLKQIQSGRTLSPCAIVSEISSPSHGAWELL